MEQAVRGCAVITVRAASTTVAQLTASVGTAVLRASSLPSVLKVSISTIMGVADALETIC